MKTFEEARPQGTPTWFDLSTPDVRRAAEFYAALFGWSYDASGEEFGFYHTAKVDGRAAAGMGQPPQGTPPAWAVMFAADDAEAMQGQAITLGATPIVGPMEVPEQGHMALLQDPTGAVFGLWQALGHHGAEVTDAHGAMTWCEVNTPDAEAAKAFYTELLGTTAEPMEGAGTTYYVLSKDGEAIGGILQMNEPWEGVPPHWMPYFQVSDADVAADAVRAGGGTVSVEPFDTTYGRIVVANDPAGAVFSVVAPPERRA